MCFFSFLCIARDVLLLWGISSNTLRGSTLAILMEDFRGCRGQLTTLASLWIRPCTAGNSLEIGEKLGEVKEVEDP
ncbi:hypothetical protein PRUPE_1G292300 [Prunus persica]|uniref:Secreted protein n=1 Tax=Prunus persica TaxID=3760 RepID=A0A251R4Y9_PRUPE|nr:hypothetical protein PRUPE_1G292300 [Prunus persica]